MPIKHAGISAQTMAEDMPRDREEAKRYVRDLYQQMEVALRKHIGEVKPRGEVIFSMDGPAPDPSVSSLALQGKPELVYVFTCAVPVEMNDLPADCTAYHALKSS
jgi:hypothetical protein